MANEFIKIPRLNPYRLFEQSGNFAVNLLPSHEIKLDYCHLAQFTDKLNLQFSGLLIDIMPTYEVIIEASIITYDETIIKELYYEKKLSSVISDYITYEILNDFTDLTENIYYLRIIIKQTQGSNIIKSTTIYSEPIWVAETHDNTCLLTYTNELNDFDVIFDSQYSAAIIFYKRVAGGFPSNGFTPYAINVAYENQINDTTLLNSVPYHANKMLFGCSRGIPNFEIEKINRAISCSNFQIDGTQYSRNNNSNFEAIRADYNYPFAGWSIELTRSMNNYSDEIGYNEEGSTVIGYGTNAIGFDDMAVGW
jgi:hypothetical protein